MLDIAKATGNADLLITGHAHACICHCRAGELTKAVKHADKVLDLYDAETHRHLADILNQDPETQAGIFGSICTWMLGYPDRALRLNDEKDAHARRRTCAGAPKNVSAWVGRTACPCCGRCWHPCNMAWHL
jgi:hypothetical protein